MDDEARRQLIEQAIIQAAREDAKHARANLPLGMVLVGVGVALATGFALLPVGLVGHVLGIGLGMMMIPCGLAVIIKAAVTIARSNKILRDNAPAKARLVD